MEFSKESKTFFIPLYGKYLMSKKQLFINDPKAEEIINGIDFMFDDIRNDIWTNMYIAAKSAIIDMLCEDYIKKNKETTIIHLGCGLDSRILRINGNYNKWYDLDLNEVIILRRYFFEENKKYKMIGKSVNDLEWIDEINNVNENILLIAEGLTMYLSEENLKKLLEGIYKKFKNVTLIFDAYSSKGIKKLKQQNKFEENIINEKWTMDKPEDFNSLHNNLVFINEHIIKFNEKNLSFITRFIFYNIYCKIIAKSYCKIYEYKMVKK